jgi:hypothetical protein
VALPLVLKVSPRMLLANCGIRLQLWRAWWVLTTDRISARRTPSRRVWFDLVGALELSVYLAAGGSRLSATCLRLVL